MINVIERTIHYYEIIGKFNPGHILDTRKYNTYFQDLLSQVKKVVSEKSSIRYQPMGERFIFINELDIISRDNKVIIKGKLLSVRKDFFPELLHTGTDITRDISANAEEGIVETTHFIIQEKLDNKSNKMKLALEYNLFGAKINDLVYYLQQIGRAKDIVQYLSYAPIVKNNLSAIKERIGEISKIYLKIHKDNLDVLKTVAPGVFSSLEAASDEFEQTYLTVELKYDIRNARHAPTGAPARKAKSIVNRFIDSLINRPENVEKYEILEVKAEDSEKNDRMNSFDLLIDKITDKIKVQRREMSRTVVSLDMFEQMNQSWINTKIR